MPRIKINDLPQDVQISKEEMKKVFGGLGAPKPITPMSQQQFLTPGMLFMVDEDYSCRCCAYPQMNEALVQKTGR